MVTNLKNFFRSTLESNHNSYTKKVKTDKIKHNKYIDFKINIKKIFNTGTKFLSNKIHKYTNDSRIYIINMIGVKTDIFFKSSIFIFKFRPRTLTFFYNIQVLDTLPSFVTSVEFATLAYSNLLLALGNN